jgi:hypothetical protein
MIEVNGLVKNVNQEHFGEEIDNSSPRYCAGSEASVYSGQGGCQLDSIQTCREENSKMALRGGKVALHDGEELEDGLGGELLGSWCIFFKIGEVEEQMKMWLSNRCVNGEFDGKDCSCAQ